jgi:hypothetical protein
MSLGMSGKGLRQTVGVHVASRCTSTSNTTGSGIGRAHCGRGLSQIEETR